MSKKKKEINYIELDIADVNKSTKKQGKFPKNLACETYECEYWKQSALEHKSNRHRRWIISIIWIIISLVTSFTVATFLNNLYSDIMGKIPDPEPVITTLFNFIKLARII